MSRHQNPNEKKKRSDEKNEKVAIRERRKGTKRRKRLIIPTKKRNGKSQERVAANPQRDLTSVHSATSLSVQTEERKNVNCGRSLSTTQSGLEPVASATVGITSLLRPVFIGDLKERT